MHILCSFMLLWPQALEARVLSGPEADSNARRQVGGEVPRPDLLWRSQATLRVERRDGPHGLSLDGQAGAKVFMNEHDQDQAVLDLRVRHEWSWLPWLTAFSEASGRDRRQRSGARTYLSALGDVGLTLGPWQGAFMTVGSGPRLFLFWPEASLSACGGGYCALPTVQWDGQLRVQDAVRFSNLGPGAYLAVGFRPTPVEVLTASLGLDGRLFPLGYRAVGVVDGERVFSVTSRRVDGTAFAEASLESVRALYLRGALRLMTTQSNSRGERYYRGRVSLTAGAVLPGGVRALLEGQLQATRWPEGLGLGEKLALQETDENQTNLQAQLSLPLPLGLWLEGRTAGYTSELSAARTSFLRLTAFLGLSARW